MAKSVRVCSKGHRYYKSSDCPVCPICEKANAPESGFLSKLSAPARRALQNSNILTVHKLANYTEKEILLLHGIGKSSIPKLKKELAENGLSFKIE